jgi:hypothetical protein
MPGPAFVHDPDGPVTLKLMSAADASAVSSRPFMCVDFAGYAKWHRSQPILREETCFACLPAGGAPFVAAGSRAGENVDEWHPVQAGSVHPAVPYHSIVVLP